MCHALGSLMYVLFVWGWVWYSEVGGANGNECYRELLKEGGYLWRGGCVGEY
jgi:hypothetical protein